MAAKSRKNRREYHTESFIQLPKALFRTEAWRSLSYGARALYLILESLYNGNNNGELYLSHRQAADWMPASKTSAAKWFDELIEKGFIQRNKPGCLGVHGRGLAATWRITRLACNGQRPTHDYRLWRAKKIKNPYH